MLRRNRHMRNLIACLMALLLAVTSIPAFAEGTDFSSMNDDEIKALIAAARAELDAREITANGITPTIEIDGVTLSFTGEIEFFGSTGLILRFKALEQNGSESAIKFRVTNITVNDWAFREAWIQEVPAGAKANVTIDVTTNGEFENIEDIDSFTATFTVIKDGDSSNAQELGSYTVHFGAN